jgi:flagellar biosynthesis/type III secretory pathway protein FliH
MRVDTATATSSTNDIDSERYLFTYNEVQELIDEAKLEGWREGMDEGYRMGKEKGVEDGKEEGKRQLLEGYNLGVPQGESLVSIRLHWSWSHRLTEPRCILQNWGTTTRARMRVTGGSDVL